MPTTIIIENCPYNYFQIIRTILNHPKEGVGFAVQSEYIVNDNDESLGNIGKFAFMDSKYIPELLWQFAQFIPGNDNRVEKCNWKIRELMSCEDVKEFLKK